MNRAASPTRLAVAGAGAWGTVLSLLLLRNGHRVKLWTRRAETAESLRRTRQNSARLPGVALPAELTIDFDLAAATHGAAAVFLAVPSVAFADVAARLEPVPLIVSCSKGLLRPGLTRLSEELARVRPGADTAVLSGPNLAPEIASGLPAAAVAASDDARHAELVQVWLQSSRFRVYTSPDPAGAEAGGALKNVIALAAGMSDGLGLGENAKASIVTRGLVEMVRVGMELGARRETLYGLAGIGDLMATCASRGSRNHTAGQRIARGTTREELEREGLTAEGIPTVRAVHDFAAERRLALPIATEVYRVIFERKDPLQAIEDLMSRERRPEW